MTRTLAIIPARGGSKGVPRKNVRMIAGKPLIAWTIEGALAARGVDRVIVSTEDQEIAEVSRTWGADVPFIRPAELARDDTAGIMPVLQAIEAVPGYDRLLLLQPTSPLRGPIEIEALLAFADAGHHESVVSVTETHHSPYWCFERDAESRLLRLFDKEVARRQDQPELVSLNGAMYLAGCEPCAQRKALIGPDTRAFLMGEAESVDIDTPFDWMIAEFLLGQRIKGEHA
jgi:CMP-N,N'-diacetyllegionaminic acid synthase